MKKYFIEYTEDNLENEYLTFVSKSSVSDNFIYMTKHFDKDDIYFLTRIVKIKKIKKIDYNRELFLLEFNQNRINYMDYLHDKGIKIKNLAFKIENFNHFYNEKIIN